MARARKAAPLALVADMSGAADRVLEGELIGGAPAPIETLDVREMALVHGAKAIGALAHIAENGASEASRIAAANALLDRAYGKVRTGAMGPEAVEREVRLTVIFV